MATKRKYDFGYKLRAIKRAEEIGNRPTAAKHGIDINKIRTWRNQRENLTTTFDKSPLNLKLFRLKGSGHQAMYPNKEEEIVRLILAKREKFLRVTRNDIACHAE